MSLQNKSKNNITSSAMSLRLDPRSKFLIDLLAREQKRSLTAVIEWAVERAAADMPFVVGDGGSYLAMIDKLWSSDESTRLTNLAQQRPDLLTYDELRIWETIKVSDGFWREGVLQGKLVQAHWPALLEQVERRKHLPTNKPFELT